jgi:hypothetical protein
MGISNGPPDAADEYAVRVSASRGVAVYSPRGDKLVSFPKGRKASKLSHLADRGIEGPAGVTFSDLHEALLARAPPHLRKERPPRVPKPLLQKINRWKRDLAEAAKRAEKGEPSGPAERCTALLLESLRGQRPLPRDLARVQEADPGAAEAVSRLLFPFRDAEGVVCRTELEGLPEPARRFLDNWASPTELRTGPEEFWFSKVFPGRTPPSEVSIDWELDDLEEAVLSDLPDAKEAEAKEAEAEEGEAREGEAREAE